MPELALTVGVLADTHVPDRALGLHPHILGTFRAQQVNQILHAGDICSPDVLEELAQVAPVTAVRGNRDWLLMQSLPAVQNLTLAGVPAALLHGHGSTAHYLWDKALYMVEGYRFERYQKLIQQSAPYAKLVVFGHTHRPLVKSENGVLYFNPGSACNAFRTRDASTIGVLRFFVDGTMQGEIVALSGYILNNRQWQAI